MDWRLTSVSEENILSELDTYLSEIDKKLTDLENLRGTKVILLAFHDLASITRDVVDDFEFYLQEHMEEIKEKDIDIVLHTTGGDADAAYHLGIRLQSISEGRKLRFIILRYAKSAGTLLACSGDEILMTPISELGPVDPQVYVKDRGRWISARTVRDSFKQVIETLGESEMIKRLILSPSTSTRILSLIETIAAATLREIPLIELGHYSSLVGHGKDLVTELLSRRMLKNKSSSEKIEDISKDLVETFSYHGRVIHIREARRIGLKVIELKEDEQNCIYEIYKIIKGLFNKIDEIILPFIRVTQLLPHISAKKINHGLIYIPLLELA